MSRGVITSIARCVVVEKSVSVLLLLPRDNPIKPSVTGDVQCLRFRRRQLPILAPTATTASAMYPSTTTTTRSVMLFLATTTLVSYRRSIPVTTILFWSMKINVSHKCFMFQKRIFQRQHHHQNQHRRLSRRSIKGIQRFQKRQLHRAIRFKYLATTTTILLSRSPFQATMIHSRRL